MGLFSTKKSYLGIDLGASSIKVVELANEGGRARLVTYGFIEQPLSQVGKEDIRDRPKEAAKLLKEVCKKAKTTTNKVIAALPTFSVFTSIINLPTMPEKELPSAIRWEAKKVIPMPLEEAILDWKILEDVEKKAGESPEQSRRDKQQKILLTAAAKDLVKKYVEVFKESGLALLSLETEAFAMIRSLVGNDKSAILIVDIGASNTDLSVIDKGIPALNRSIDLGGMNVTQNITQILNIGIEEAEQFKQDTGLTAVESAGSQGTIEKALAPIINEIKYTLNLYQGEKGEGSRTIEKIIITGGSAYLPNLPEYLSKVLDKKVYIGDPWARVIYPEDLKPVLDEIGPRFSVAIGLAMRDIQ